MLHKNEINFFESWKNLLHTSIPFWSAYVTTMLLVEKYFQHTNCYLLSWDLHCTILMQQWHSDDIYKSSYVTPGGTSWLFGCVCLWRTATKQLEGKIMKQAFHVEHKKSGLTIIMCISVYAFITQSNTKGCLSSSNAPPPTPQKKLDCWQICSGFSIISRIPQSFVHTNTVIVMQNKWKLKQRLKKDACFLLLCEMSSAWHSIRMRRSLTLSN